MRDLAWRSSEEIVAFAAAMYIYIELALREYFNNEIFPNYGACLGGLGCSETITKYQ